MKTINGKNKTERLINKANKYLGLILKQQSNKYFRIDQDESDLSNKYVTLESNVKLIDGKYGPVLLIQNDNMENPIFVKTWKAMKSSYYDFNVVLFEYEKLIPELQGQDDLFTLKEWMNKNSLLFSKNSFYKV